MEQPVVDKTGADFAAVDCKVLILLCEEVWQGIMRDNLFMTDRAYGGGRVPWL